MGRRLQVGQDECGSGGNSHSGKDPRHPLYVGRGQTWQNSLGWREKLELLLLGSPSPCPPGLYQGLRHSTGTRVGRRGLEKSPLQEMLRKALPHHGLLPFTRLPREGVPVKGSGPASKLAGRGRDRSGGATAQAGRLPATQEWRHQAEEGLAPELPGTLRNLKPIVQRCGPLQPQVLPFWVGPCLQQQPCSLVSSPPRGAWGFAFKIFSL